MPHPLRVDLCGHVRHPGSVDPIDLGIAPWRADRLERAYQTAITSLKAIGATDDEAADASKGLLDRVEWQLFICELMERAGREAGTVEFTVCSESRSPRLSECSGQLSLASTFVTRRVRHDRDYGYKHPKARRRWFTSTRGLGRVTRGSIVWLVRHRVHEQLLTLVASADRAIAREIVPLCDAFRYQPDVPAFMDMTPPVSVWHAIACLGLRDPRAWLSVARAGTDFSRHASEIRRALWRARLYRELLRVLFSRLRPRLVVVCDHRSQLELAAGRVAQELGVPAASLQHGVFWDTPRKMSLPFSEYYVFGTRDARILERRGCPSQAVHVVGSPMFSRGEGEQGSHASQTRRIILVSDRPKGPVTAGMLRDMAECGLRAAGQLRHVELLVKVHPTEMRSVMEEVVRGSDSNVTIERSGLMRDVFRSGDLVVGLHTTALLEAALRGLVAVSYSPFGLLDRAEYDEYGVAHVVRRREELTDQIVEFGRRPRLPDRYDRLGEYVELEGDAARRIAERLRVCLET